MSNKRKLPKTNDEEYTIDDLVEDATEGFAARVSRIIAKANEEGKHGVMVIVGESAEISDLVPFGKVWQAGSQEAVDRLRARQAEGDMGLRGE